MLDEVQFIRDKHGEIVSPYDTARGRALDIVPWHIP